MSNELQILSLLASMTQSLTARERERARRLEGGRQGGERRDRRTENRGTHSRRHRNKGGKANGALVCRHGGGGRIGKSLPSQLGGRGGNTTT